jgi:large subunit ribosomal protein L23
MSTPERPKGEAARAAAARGADAAAASKVAAKEGAPKKTASATGKAAKSTAAAGAAKAASAKRVKRTAPRPRHSEGRLAQVLVAPIVSEKATLVSEKRNQVTFQVLRDATKPEIKAAVELMFKVEVESVQTLVQKGKVKKFGRSIGRRDHVKKAYVSLKPGQELNNSGEGA